MEIISPGNAGKELTRGINHLIAQLTDTPRSIPAARIEAIIDSECSHLLVAVDRGAVVGMLTLVLHDIPTGTRAMIEDVVVDSAARGQGAGRALIQKALARAEALGADAVYLSSAPERRAANRLYRKMNFKIRETNVYRYSMPGGSSRERGGRP